MRPIGIFDSGFGGLTVLKSILAKLPEYDYLYLGDNARAPYGHRSYETVYQYTLECVRWLLLQNCPLVILACNTASAKALRTIQQNDLPRLAPQKRVLGVIRPTAEVIGTFSETKKVGILGTEGTVNSGSYQKEIEHFFPDLSVYQQACPLWVPLIENKLRPAKALAMIIREDLTKLMRQCDEIDTVLLACTHYPLIENEIRQQLQKDVRLVTQGPLVAGSLDDYLARHPDLEQQVTRGGQRRFYTTDSVANFEDQASRFFGGEVKAELLDLIVHS